MAPHREGMMSDNSFQAHLELSKEGLNVKEVHYLQPQLFGGTQIGTYPSLYDILTFFHTCSIADP